MRNPSAKVTNKKKSGSGINGSSTSTTTPCCSKVGLKRGPWTPEEDEVLANYIRKEGEGRWRTLPKRAGLLRCGKSCRLRWMNYLRPSVKRGQIAPDEEDLILRLHRLLGNRWSLIAGRIPGRTDNEIKNYWNTHLSKKLISQGIDPRTHKPLNPPHPSSSSTPPPPPPPYKPPPIIASHHITPPSSAPPPRLITTTTVNHEFDPSRDHLAQYQQQAPVANSVVTDDGACGNFNNVPAAAATDDVSAMDHLLTANNEDVNYDDINYCSDDVFSSFLNSLINEDAFAAQRHLQSDHVDIALPSDDPLISSAPPPYGLGAVVWESPLVSATQNDPSPKRVVDHHE